MITRESCLFSTRKAVGIYSGCFRKTSVLARPCDRALWGHGGGSVVTRPQNNALHPSRADGGVKEYRAKIKQNSSHKDTTSCAHILHWATEHFVAVCGSLIRVKDRRKQENSSQVKLPNPIFISLNNQKKKFSCSFQIFCHRKYPAFECYTCSSYKNEKADT